MAVVRDMCPACDGDLRISIPELKDHPHVVLGGEYLAVEPLAAAMVCQRCPWRREGRVRRVTIDVRTGVFLSGEFQEVEP